MNIAILHDRILPDAREDERDALVQAEAVAAGLAELGHTSFTLPVTLNLEAIAGELRARNVVLVFNLVESLEGHGRLIHLVPALLDAIGMPYTGAPTEAMLRTTHKLLAKRELRAAGIRTPAWISSTPSAADAPAPPGRYIIKSVWEHASVGMDDDAVCDVADPARLVEELRRRAAALGGEAFAEQYIEGREFNVAVLAGPGGPQVLPPAEMRFLDFPPGKPHIVGYRAKWVEDSFEYRNTVRTFEARPGDHALHLQLIELATACWHRFGLRGYARVDFRVDAAGRPWVLEVNANPCLAPDAGFLAAATAGGLSLRDVLGRILADVSAMRRA